MAERLPTAAFAVAATDQAPRGLTIRQVDEAPLRADAPQATMREALKAALGKAKDAGGDRTVLASTR